MLVGCGPKQIEQHRFDLLLLIHGGQLSVQAGGILLPNHFLPGLLRGIAEQDPLNFVVIYAPDDQTEDFIPDFLNVCREAGVRVDRIEFNHPPEPTPTLKERWKRILPDKEDAGTPIVIP